MERKEFIKTCGLACLGGVILSTGIQSCGSSAYYAKSTYVGNKLSVKKSEFVNATEGQNSIRNFVLVKSDKLEFPICVYRFSESSYSALSTKCTHSGCEVKPQQQLLVCPCHGSEFTNKGEVQNPPAEENLKTYKITTDNEFIYIEL
jgi:cytochrome b6-f complex iron-sulfur subunit